jgi:hypothetical protein
MAIDINELVGRIFKERFLCETTKLSLSILQDLPKESDVYEILKPATETFNHITGVTRIEINNNTDNLIDLVFGVSRNNVGEAFNRFKNNDAIEQTVLSTAQLAELVYNKGSVTIVNAMDTIVIYELIEQYINEIKNKTYLDMLYTPPPEEDMKAFINLYNLLYPIAKQQIAIKNETDKKVSLLNYNTATGTVKQELFSKVVINGRSNQVAY